MSISVEEDARTCVSFAEHPSGARATPYDGFRVAVIGSCQVGGIASALKQLLAGARVDFWHYGVTPGAAEEIAEAITGCDLVISQLLPDMAPRCLAPRELQQKCHSFVLMPIFGFPGLHPDCVLIDDPSGGAVETPLGPYNSSIIFSAYLLGFDAKKTKSLFNAFIYKKLGFFDAFTSSKNAIVTAFRELGYEIGDLIDGWLKRYGCFMYTTNHPRGEVMWDMGILALARAGLKAAEPQEALADQYLSLNAIWPVYPELGRELSIHGSLRFTMPGFDHHLSDPRNVDLHHYISASFESYGKYDCSALAHANDARMGRIVRALGSAVARYAG